MDGRIVRLIDDQQFGTIAADGGEYRFSSISIVGATFGQLHIGAHVSFTPIIGRGFDLRAEDVRLISK